MLTVSGPALPHLVPISIVPPRSAATVSISSIDMCCRATMEAAVTDDEALLRPSCSSAYYSSASVDTAAHCDVCTLSNGRIFYIE